MSAQNTNFAKIIIKGCETTILYRSNQIYLHREKQE